MVELANFIRLNFAVMLMQKLASELAVVQKELLVVGECVIFPFILQ